MTKTVELMDYSDFERRAGSVAAEIRGLMNATGLGYVVIMAAPGKDGAVQMDVQTNMTNGRDLARAWAESSDDEAEKMTFHKDPPRN